MIHCNNIAKFLAGVGLKIQFKPQGSFFLFAEIPKSCIYFLRENSVLTPEVSVIFQF
jgi:hypothetical protein